MWLKIVLIIIEFASSIKRWAERQRWKAEGREEAERRAQKTHDERVALAEAARADADALAAGGVPDPTDPFDRDNADRR